MKNYRTLFVFLLLAETISRTFAEGTYTYPLTPGTAAWANATAPVRVAAAAIPKSWLKTASSGQLFRAAVTNPYFRSLLEGSQTITEAYNTARQSAMLGVLSDADSAPAFGSEALSYLRGLSLASLTSTRCSQFNGPCWMDYLIICYMTGLDSALNTMDQPSRQTVFRLAVWDANYFISGTDYQVAAADVALMYIIYNKPVSFRGAFPPSVTLPTLSEAQVYALAHGDLPSELIPAISAVKSSLGLTARP